MRCDSTLVPNGAITRHRRLLSRRLGGDDVAALDRPTEDRPRMPLRGHAPPAGAERAFGEPTSGGASAEMVAPIPQRPGGLLSKGFPDALVLPSRHASPGKEKTPFAGPF